MIVTWGISCQACFDPLVDHCLMGIYFIILCCGRQYFHKAQANNLTADLLGVPNTMALTRHK